MMQEICTNFLVRKPRVETKAISSFNASSVTVSSAFSAAPDGEVIYAVSGQTAQGAVVTGSFKRIHNC